MCDNDKLICKLCGHVNKDEKSLTMHLSFTHKYSTSEKKDYYDKYFKKETEGVCYFCGEPALFYSISRGYHRICTSTECVSKTRSSATPEFWMYKNNISMEEALVIHNERMNKMGNSVKRVFKKMLETDPYFNKKRSHQTKEFWMNKGFTEEESIVKSLKVMKMIHNKTSIKRKTQPELYTDSYNTQTKFWTKRGFTEKEAEEKVKDRQRTFTLEKCIEKHGKEEGTFIYNERQRKWSEKMEEKYQNGDYQKFTVDNYSKPEIELMSTICDRLNLNKVKYGKDQFFRYFPEIGRTFAYDFYHKNKIIEFNGDYWHCNPKIYEKDFFNKSKQKYAWELWEEGELKNNSIKELGYEVLVIWESDYYKDKERVIEQCINFLSE